MSGRWWCHTCAREAPLGPWRACALCGGEFVEEVDEEEPPERFEAQGAAPPLNPIQEMLRGLVAGTAGGAAGAMRAGLLFGDVLARLQEGAGAARAGDFASDAQMQGILARLFEGASAEPSGNPRASEAAVRALEEQRVGVAEEDAGLECPVCQERLVAGERLLLMPCAHRFHADCLLPWLRLKNTCPVCRREIEGEEPERARPAASPAAAPATAPGAAAASSAAARAISPVPSPPSFSSSEEDDEDARSGTRAGGQYDDMFL